MYGLVRFVGHREVGPHRREAQGGRAAIAFASHVASPGRQPTRCMPVSTFRWTAARSSRAGGGRPARRRRRRCTPPVRDGLATARSTSRGGGSKAGAPARRCRRPADSSPSSMRATASRVAPAARPRGRATAPWPYPSAFTTAQSSPAPRSRGQDADVVGDGVGVDLGPGGGPHAHPLVSSSAAGSATIDRTMSLRLMMPTRLPPRTTGSRDTSWSCRSSPPARGCRPPDRLRVGVITSPTLPPKARRMSSSKCFFAEAGSMGAPRNDRTVGKCGSPAARSGRPW